MFHGGVRPDCVCQMLPAERAPRRSRKALGDLPSYSGEQVLQDETFLAVLLAPVTWEEDLSSGLDQLGSIP